MNKVLVMKCRGNLPSGAPGLGTAFCCSRVALPAAFVTNRQVPRSSGFRTPEYLGIGQLSQAGPHTRFSSYERQAVIYRLPRRRWEEDTYLVFSRKVPPPPPLEIDQSNSSSFDNGRNQERMRTYSVGNVQKLQEFERASLDQKKRRSQKTSWGKVVGGFPSAKHGFLVFFCNYTGKVFISNISVPLFYGSHV